MKIFNRIIILIFIMGVILIGVAFSQGLELRNLGDFFIDDEAYGEKLEYVATTILDEIDINVDTRHIIVKESTTDEMTITYYAKEKDIVTINELNGKLSLVQKSQNEAFSWFSFKFGSYEVMSITIFVPSDMIINYTLSSDTGDIKYIEGPSQAHNLMINADTGSIKLEDIEMDALTIDNDTGSISLKSLNVSGNVKVSVDTGSIHTDYTEANALEIYTNTGSITITDSDIVGLMELETDTGSIYVAQSDAANYDFKIDTGSVEFANTTLPNISLDLQTDTGSIRVNGDSKGRDYQSTNGPINLNIEVDTGSIKVNILD